MLEYTCSCITRFRYRLYSFLNLTLKLFIVLVLLTVNLMLYSFDLTMLLKMILLLILPFLFSDPKISALLHLWLLPLNDQILNAYKDDEFYSDTYNQLNSDQTNSSSKLQNFSISNSYLLFKNKIYVLPKCRSSVLNICHDSPSAGHFGI